MIIFLKKWFSIWHITKFDSISSSAERKNKLSLTAKLQELQQVEFKIKKQYTIYIFNQFENIR